MQAGIINVELRLDKGQYDVNIRSAGQQMKTYQGQLEQTSQSVKKVEGAHSTATTMLRNFVLTVASVKFAIRDLNETIFALPTAAIKASGEIERMTALMRGLSTATTDLAKKTDAANNVKYVFDLAQNAPFSVNALADAFVKLKSGGLDPTKGAMQAVVDSVAKFGGSADQLNRASTAIQQMMGKGVISMEELRQQLGEAIPDAMAMMANASGQTMAEFTKNVSLGTVESASAINRMTTMMNIKNREAAVAMMDTWTGMLEQLKTQWTLALNDIGQSGLSDAAKDSLKAVSDLLKNPEFRVFASEVGRAFGEMISSITSAIQLAVEYREEIVTIGHYLLLAFGASKLLPHLESMWNSLKGFYANAMGAIGTYKLAKQNEADYIIALANKEHLQRQLLVTKEMELKAKAAAASVMAAEKDYMAQQELAMKKKILQQTSFDAYDLDIAKRASRRNIELAQANGMHGAELAHFRMTEAQKLATYEKGMLSRATARNADLANTLSALERESLARTAVAQQQVATAATLSAISKKAIIEAEATAAAITGIGVASSRTAVLLGVLKGALGLLLNPLTILMLAVEAGIRIWDKWGEAARKAKEKVQQADDVKRGIASKDTLASAETELADMNAKMQRLSNMRANKDNAIARYKGNPELLKKLEAERDAIDADMTAQAKGIAEQKVIIDKSLAIVNRADISGRVGAFNEVINDNSKMWMAHKSEEYNAIQDKLRASKEGVVGAVLSATEQKALEAQQHVIMRERLAGEVKMYDSQIADSETGLSNINKQIAKAKVDSKEYKRLLKEQAIATEEINTLRGQVAQRRITYEDAGKFDSTVMNAKTDPKANGGGAGQKSTSQKTISWMDKTMGEISILKAKYKTITVSADQLAAVRDEAIAILDLALMEGKFDYKVKSKSKDGKKTISTEVRPDAVPEIAIQMQSEKLAIEKIVPEFKKALANAEADFKSVDDFVNNNLIKSASKADNYSEGDAYVPQSVVAFRQALEVERGNIKEQILLLTNDRDGLDAALFASAQLASAQLESSVKPIEQNLYAADTQKYLTELAKKNAGLQTFYQSEDQLREAAYQREVALVNARVDLTKMNTAQQVLAKADLDSQLERMEAAHIYAMKSPMAKLADQWGDVTTQMKNASVGWANQSLDAMMNFVKTGKIEFRSLAESILSDILRIRMQQQMAGMMNTAIDFAVNAIGGIFSPASSAPAAYSGIGEGSNMLHTPVQFADGGVMSGFGEVPMNYYSQGGVANSPQVAVFGEGRTNEAFVPLPDGRSIPVTMKGGGGSNVVVNVINAPAGTETRQTQNQDGSTNIDVIIAQVEGKISQNVSKGRGSLSGVMEKTYGLNRAMGSYG